MEELTLSQHCDNYFIGRGEDCPRWIEPTAWLHQPAITTPVIFSSTDQFTNNWFPELNHHIFQEAHSYATTTYHDEHLSESQVTFKSGTPARVETAKIPNTQASKTLKMPKPPSEDPGASAELTRHLSHPNKKSRWSHKPSLTTVRRP